MANTDSWFITEYYFHPIIHTLYNLAFFYYFLFICKSHFIKPISCSSNIHFCFFLFFNAFSFLSSGFYELPICFHFITIIFVYSFHYFVDIADWKQLKSFSILPIGFPSQKNFTILSIVLIGSSLISAMFHFNEPNLAACSAITLFYFVYLHLCWYLFWKCK